MSFDFCCSAVMSAVFPDPKCNLLQGFSWYWGMFRKNATFVEDYGHGTCFRRELVTAVCANAAIFVTVARVAGPL